jgi:RNA binding exosome subunit
MNVEIIQMFQWLLGIVLMILIGILGFLGKTVLAKLSEIKISSTITETKVGNTDKVIQEIKKDMGIFSNKIAVLEKEITKFSTMEKGNSKILEELKIEVQQLVKKVLRHEQIIENLKKLNNE